MFEFYMFYESYKYGLGTAPNIEIVLYRKITKMITMKLTASVSKVWDGQLYII